MTSTELDELERAVLEKLLLSDAPPLRELREQLDVCEVQERERTGHGFFSMIVVDRSAAAAPISHARFGDVQAEIEGLEHGAGFVLTIAEGYLHMLEGYSYDEPWPDEVAQFSLSYLKEPRDLSALS